MTDETIRVLIELPKFIEKAEQNKLLSRKQENAYTRAQAALVCESEYTFMLHIRESLDDPMDFSVILSTASPDTGTFNLIRCNGGSVPHRNHIEKNRIYGPHIHLATERYIQLQREAEAFARPTADYTSCSGALKYILKLAHISTVSADDGSRSLFDE